MENHSGNLWHLLTDSTKPPDTEPTHGSQSSDIVIGWPVGYELGVVWKATGNVSFGGQRECKCLLFTLTIRLRHFRWPYISVISSKHKLSGYTPLGGGEVKGSHFLIPVVLSIFRWIRDALLMIYIVQWKITQCGLAVKERDKCFKKRRSVCPCFFFSKSKPVKDALRDPTL